MLDDESGVGRRKPVHRTVEERAAIVAETYEPGRDGSRCCAQTRYVCNTVVHVAERRQTQGFEACRRFCRWCCTPNTAQVPHDGVEIISGAVSVRLPKSTPPKRIADIARHLAQY